MTKIRDKRCQNISNDKDTWQKVSNNLIKSTEWETIQHYGCQFIFGNARLHPDICVDIYDNIHGNCPDIHGEMTFGHLICIHETRNLVYDMALDGMS